MNALVSLLVGVAIGFVAQRSRFCTVAPIRNVILTRDWAQIKGIAAFGVTGFFLYSLAHHFGWLPWDASSFGPRLLPTVAVVALAAAGLGFVSLLMGACPARQHVLAAEGNRDAWLYLAGFGVGIVIFHLFTSRVLYWLI